jgi:hypothetical protein
MYATILAPDGTVLTMDVTSDWTKTLVGVPTDNPVESGASIADHYYLEPKTFTLNGIVTFLKVGSNKRNPLTPKEWDTYIEAVMQSKQPLIVSLDDEFTSPINNALITNYNIIKDSTSKDALGVSLSFKQVIVTQKARETTIDIPAKAGDAGANGDGNLTGEATDKGHQTTSKAPEATAALKDKSSGDAQYDAWVAAKQKAGVE